MGGYMTDSNIEKTLINGEIEHPKQIGKRNFTTKRPKIYLFLLFSNNCQLSAIIKWIADNWQLLEKRRKR